MVESEALAYTRWPVVLAGGEGARMRPAIREWFGRDLPKQFCAFVGTRSMLEHTLARAGAITPEHRIITVVRQGQRRLATNAVSGSYPGIMFEQPGDCGTAAAVLLAAAYVRNHDESGTLVIMPSDHFILPNHRLVHHVLYADFVTRQFEDVIVLLGAVPESAEVDYGWIVPGTPRRAWVTHQFVPEPRHVTEFKEKPDVKEARALWRRGGLWNTMIVVVRVKTLWALARDLLPAMTSRFEDLGCELRDKDCEAEFLDDAYRGLESADFSRDLLQASTRSTLVIPMNGVEWSDWGRPQRVIDTAFRMHSQKGQRQSLKMPDALGGGRNPRDQWR